MIEADYSDIFFRPVDEGVIETGPPLFDDVQKAEPLSKVSVRSSVFSLRATRALRFPHVYRSNYIS
jgi:hypothetical protein